MEKRNKILIGILTICLIVGIGAFVKVALFDKEEKTEVVQTSSVISKIDGTKIILSNKKKFDLKESNKDQTEYNEGNHVIVEYDKNKENEEYIPAISITLSVSKEPATPDAKNAMDKKISEIMNGMSLDEKVAQMFMVRCPSSDAVLMSNNIKWVDTSCLMQMSFLIPTSNSSQIILPIKTLQGLVCLLELMKKEER